LLLTFTYIFIVRIRIEEITYKLLTNQLEIPKDERDRSPSPEPQYDVQGKRSNTRDQRAREKLMKDRQRLVERCTELFPLFKPPPDYRPLQIKKTKKYLFLLTNILSIISLVL